MAPFERHLQASSNRSNNSQQQQTKQRMPPPWRDAHANTATTCLSWAARSYTEYQCMQKRQLHSCCVTRGDLQRQRSGHREDQRAVFPDFASRITDLHYYLIVDRKSVTECCFTRRPSTYSRQQVLMTYEMTLAVNYINSFACFG